MRGIVVEAHQLSPELMRRLDVQHGFTTYRLDEHDACAPAPRPAPPTPPRPPAPARLRASVCTTCLPRDRRRRIMRNGFDAYSPPGTIQALSALAAEHAAADTQMVKYSAKHPGLRPAGDNVTRLQLEEELFAVRNMRHVFRVKRNISLQGWVTVLNPVLPHGYPPHLMLTTEPDLTEPTTAKDWWANSPEHQKALRDPATQPQMRECFKLGGELNAC